MMRPGWIYRLFCLIFCVALAFAGAGVTAVHADPQEPPDENPDPIDPPDTPITTVEPEGSCGDCDCYIEDVETILNEVIPQATEDTRNALYQDFWNYQNWIVSDFFDDNIRPALMDMAQQLTTVGMYQVAVFGTFLDAKQQIETQEILASLNADAHKRYQPDFDMCTIGTMSEGIGAAYQNAQTAAVIMAKYAIDRQMGSKDTASRTGPGSDKTARLREFTTFYCNPHDLNGAFAAICTAAPTSAASIDRDIDYTHTLDQPHTLDVDFTDNAGTLTVDERNILALDSNLFAHDVFQRLNANFLGTNAGPETLLEVRSVAAKRSVAEKLFFAIAGLKADGSTGSASQPYLKLVLKDLGVTDTDAALILGKRPSYYAQMDLMASKLYQTPTFFSNLYDTPANVARKDVAMQAIDLMLDRDQFKSELRTEADMAVLLELQLQKLQDTVQNRASWITENGRHD